MSDTRERQWLLAYATDMTHGDWNGSYKDPVFKLGRIDRMVQR